MAFPTSALRALPGRVAKGGITLEVYPSTTPGLTVEIQSATAAGAASSLWGSVLLSPSSAGTLRYVFPVPPSTRTFYFRARHPAQPGYSAGAFTPTVSAKPVGRVPVIQPRIVPQVTYRGNVEIPSGSDVWLSSNKTVKVGTQPTTGTITKTLRLPVGELFAQSDQDAWNIPAGSDVRPRLANTALNMVGAMVLPAGVTIKAFRFRSYRETTSDVANGSLIRVANDTTVTIATMTQTSTGWGTQSSSTLSEAVTGRTHICQTGLTGVAAAANARFGWFEVDYNMPSYDKGI